MSFQKISLKSFGTLLITLLASTLLISAQEKEMSIAGKNDMLCAGYIQSAKVDTSSEIVGATDEKDAYIYSQNNYIYFRLGSNRDAKVGDMFSVIRPRGQVKSRWTKKNNLGFFVQEVGAIEVVKVRGDVGIARVSTSCDNLLLGDLVKPLQQLTSPMFEQRPAFDIFADPSGKSTGRILMSREGRELIGTQQIVYIDLGREDNANIGDYLTIYRPLGTGNILDDLPSESVSARDYGFESNEYRGGRFSNQAARKSGDEARGRVVTTKRAKKDRPQDLRRIVGEMVILNVKEKTATALVTRTAGEIHTGDYVEVQ